MTNLRSRAILDRCHIPHSDFDEGGSCFLPQWAAVRLSYATRISSPWYSSSGRVVQLHLTGVAAWRYVLLILMTLHCLSNVHAHYLLSQIHQKLIKKASEHFKLRHIQDQLVLQIEIRGKKVEVTEDVLQRFPDRGTMSLIRIPGDKACKEGLPSPTLQGSEGFSGPGDSSYDPYVQFTAGASAFGYRSLLLLTVYTALVSATLNTPWAR